MTNIFKQIKKLCQIEKLKSLVKYFKDEKLSSDNLNTFMKKKQNLWGCIVIASMFILFLILHAVAASKSHAIATPTIQAQNTTVPDGVVSADFTQKDTESAMQMQQQEYDQLNKKVNLMLAGKEKADKTNAAPVVSAANTAFSVSTPQSSTQTT